MYIDFKRWVEEFLGEVQEVKVCLNKRGGRGKEKGSKELANSCTSKNKVMWSIPKR